MMAPSGSRRPTIGGVTRQIVRDWVVRFNAEGPEGLRDRKAPGQRSRLTDEMVADGPIPAVHGVVRCGSSIFANGPLRSFG
jgi:hypothetical protein